ncbi:MAG: methionine--tRNA ligase [Candidatus Saccharicenans sp.]|nr:MAG: methionine--tRNA ligase [Candidatus Aminicenantes bacterium]HEK85019.1 methionine--tRNA ligase [Candidatus Aminicenantes bacterium]
MEERSKNTFYVTTPIYYVNDVPHIGHAYTTIIADALARYQRLKGKKVFFLTGTDEHGQKIEKTAIEKELNPQQLADRVVVRFKELWQKLNISYDYFIRTTEKFHEEGVQKIFKKLLEKGDIYKGIYQGWYCISEENFLSEDVPLEADGYKICPDCGRRATMIEEESYFFRLSAYQKPLLEFYEANPQFVRPQTRMNEVVSFVRQGLKDLSITRTTVKWGIPVPGDPKHTIYVWFDALHNYLTGIGYDWNPELFQTFWPADVQLIGKDILRFHAIFWPAFLLASELPLPRTILGHGWWLKDEAKMSKSKGNVLDPNIILESVGADPLRYFLLREIPIGQDGNFSHEAFVHRVNSDLANDLGNLVQRTLTMAVNYFNGSLEKLGPEEEIDKKLAQSFEETKNRVYAFYDDYNLNRALEEIWGYLNYTNKYLAECQPWKIAGKSETHPRLARILYQAACALRAASYLIYPVMPQTTEKIWKLLGQSKKPAEICAADLNFYERPESFSIRRPEALFPRINLQEFIKDTKKPEGEINQPIRREEKMEYISFDEFKKMDLRVAKVLAAERVPNTNKLLKLQIDLGSEQRQIIAGVAESYSPEELVGKEFIIIANLQPAVIRGIESQGMLLAAEVEGKAIIPFFDREIPPGTKVK